MRRRSRLAIAAIVVLSTIPALVAPVAARGPQRSEHQRIVAHWTHARMASARSRDLVLDRAGKSSPQPLVANSGGQSWGIPGPNATGVIAETSGRVYFQLGSNAYVCSGSVVTDGRPGYSLVLTAGHCVYDQTQGWATFWMFVPQADGLPVVPTCDASPRGCWTAQALVAHSRFTTATAYSGTTARYDYAFAVVGPGGKVGAAPQLDALGSLPIAYTGVASGNVLYAFGYPAAAPYAGNDLVYCSGKIGQDYLNASATWSMVCNMTGGASGGPWLRAFNESTGSGTVASLNSYRYSFSNRMYGPKFTTYTQAVYNAADAVNTGDADPVEHVAVP